MARKVGECPLHPGMTLYEHSNEKGTWRAHKLPNGEWCHPEKGAEKGKENYSKFVPQKKDDTRALKKFCLELAAKTPGVTSGDEMRTEAEKNWMWLDRKGENKPEDPWSES